MFEETSKKNSECHGDVRWNGHAPRKKMSLKDNHRKEKQLKKKKKKITSATIEAQAKKENKKSNNRKSGFKEILDENDLQ